MNAQTAAATMQIRERGIETLSPSHLDQGIETVMIAVRQEERLRIAQELHDTCLQGFLTISMQLQVVAFECSGNNALKSRLEGLVEMARGAVEEGRRSVTTLRALAQSSESLDTAFARIPRDLELDSAVRLQVSGGRRLGIAGSGIARGLPNRTRSDSQCLLALGCTRNSSDDRILTRRASPLRTGQWLRNRPQRTRIRPARTLWAATDARTRETNRREAPISNSIRVGYCVGTVR
jgi:hypothetical protein